MASFSAVSASVPANYVLDHTFDTDGKVTTEFSISSSANSMAVQADGKILVSGYFNTGSSTDFMVVRYNTDGSLDNDFGAQGKVATDIGTDSWDYGNAVAVQADGKILVAGHTTASSGGAEADIAIVRYNTDGSPDNTFDTDGKVVTNITTNSADFGNAVAVQADGKILVGGHTVSLGTQDFVVVRYLADGSPDNTFDTDGKVTTNISAGSSEWGWSIGVQPDGKIIFCGLYDIGSTQDFAVVRYNADGSPDNTFDTDGKATADVVSGSTDYPRPMILQNDGKILVAGLSYVSSRSRFDIGIVRFNTNGSLDQSFDTDGRVNSDVNPEVPEETLVAMALDGDGKILVATTSSNSSDFMVLRYNTNGSLDTTFDADGKITTDIDGYDYARSIAVQPDGKILVAGTSEGVDYSISLARFKAIPVNQPTTVAPTETVASTTTVAAAPATTVAPASAPKPVIRVGKLTKGSSLATYLGLKISKGSVLRLTVSSASSKFCSVTSTSVKGKKVGTCRVTVRVTTKGKAASRTVSLRVTK